MPGPIAPVDPESLRRLRRLVQRMANGPADNVPVRDFIELGDADLGADLTLDMEATRELGAPLVVLSPRASRRIARLAPREKQIATLIAQGLTNKEIAGRLGLTLGTVKTYVHGILRKTDLPNRAAIATALQGSSL